MLLLVFALMGLSGLLGCSSTNEPAVLYEPSFNSYIVVIDAAELSTYWTADTAKKVIMLSRRPDWIPKGIGKAYFYITIDSNGTSVGRELTSSMPEGWMTQKHLDKMPTQHYIPSLANPTRIPAKVKILSELKPMG
ncbi:MAG: hypothetical protein ACJAVV_003442 [Alphaproteobacteria bacterium]|jgi:hypothetical protein